MPELLPYNLVPVDSTWRKVDASRGGPRSITGSQQVVQSDAGYWAASATFYLGNGGGRGEDRHLAYRGLMAALDGLSGQILLPCFAPYRARDINGRMLSNASMSGLGVHGLVNNLGWGIDEPELIFVHQDAARRSTRLTTRHPHVQGLRPGHFFGIGDRFYLVSGVWQISYEFGENDGGQLVFGSSDLMVGSSDLIAGDGTPTLFGENVEVITFWPPLREAVVKDMPLILGAPVCKVRLSSDNNVAITQRKISEVTLDFEECF